MCCKYVYIYKKAKRNVGHTRKAKAVVSESKKASQDVLSNTHTPQEWFYLRMKENVITDI